MLIGGTRYGRRTAAASAALGVLLVGVAGAPAHAETTREQQWHLDAMKAEQMWQTSTGEGITVAVIDTGVDPSNPDLVGRVLDGKDYASRRPGDEHTDFDGHGTGMAGLIAGTGAYGGGKGAFGLAPGAKILPIRLPGTVDISPFETSAYLSKAIRYAADSGAQVINISMNGGSDSPDLNAAVRHALDKGSLIFAAVGNDGAKGYDIGYPAAVPGIVGVAAVGRDLRRTAESQQGSRVDMAAPGKDMVHACGGETGLCKTNGTSDATAIASASAALIWSKHENWSNNQVLRVMLNTIGAPTDGAKRNDSIGYGIVRPRIALQDPGDPGPADVYPLPDLKAASASPSPEAASAGTSGASRNVDPGMEVAKPDDDDGVPWLAMGIGAAVLLGAAIAATAVALRRRRSAGPPLLAAGSGQFPYNPMEFGPSAGTSDQVGPRDRGPGGF
ncbi:type VII secretion-associated serine protease mycosin [Streptomyces sp. HC307]|uniref:type VII secretion-associated serine protease mycosin n=1 Tax=Streptomyces flavusporus TaxID=3385496 RepID=UPI003916F539